VISKVFCSPEHIKSLRKSLGLTQEQLADRLGVSFTSINRWENSQTKPSKLAKRQIEMLYNEQVKKVQKGRGKSEI
jgi:putative transcriptional regulator